MKGSIRFMINLFSLCGIALSASSALALDGPLANVTVSFGQWDPNDPDLRNNPNAFPLDRLLSDPSGGRGNKHELLPQTATIKAGGSVSFVISGGHIVSVYDDGTNPEDIGDAIETNCTGAGPFTTPCSPVNPAGEPVAGGILSDSEGRIYRGPFLNTNPARRDGVEVVTFSNPGTYLVICARKNHFVDDGMFGFVKVLP